MPPLSDVTLLSVPKLTDTQQLALSDGGNLPARPVDAAGLIAGFGSDFVFRPADPLGDHANIFVTWPSLMAAVQGIAGPKRVQVDPSLAAANTTAGTWNVDEVTFTSSTGSQQLTTIAGTLFTAGLLTLKNILIIQASTAPVLTLQPNGMLVLEDNAEILAPTVVNEPWVTFATSEAQAFLMAGPNVTLGEGTNVVAGATAGTLQVVVFGSSTIESNALTGSVNVSQSADSEVQPQPLLTGLQARTGSNVFVFQPGGIPTQSTYTTWASFMLALEGQPGPKFCIVDGTQNGVTGAQVPAGGPYNLDQTTWFSVPGATFAGRVLTWLQGATLTFSSYIRLMTNTEWRNSSTNPVMTITDNLVRTMVLDGAILETNAGAAAWFNVAVGATGGILLSLINQAVAGNNARPVVTQAAGLVDINVLSGSTLQSSAFTTTGGTFALQRGDDGIVQYPQAVAAVDVAPPHIVQSTTTTGGGTGTVTLGPTANVAQQYSGEVLVTATISVAVTNAGTVDFALNGSSSGTIANGNITAGASAAVALTLSSTDTVTPTGQTYSCVATGVGTGNLTVVGAPVINVVELK